MGRKNFIRIMKTMRRAVPGLWILLCFLAVSLPAQHPSGDSPLVIGPNYRLHPGNVDQTEVFIVKSPADPDVMFSACNTINFSPFFISEGIFSTANGGESWWGSDTCTGDPIPFHGGDPGITIDKNGTFLLTRLGRSPFVGLYSHYSNDNGHTWSAQKVISTDDLERAALATDAVQSSPYFGRSYAAWVRFAQPFPVMFSYTGNGGQSWSTPMQVNNPVNRSAGGDLAMGPNGEIYLTWAGVTDVSPFKEILVGFASSTDGGQHWDINENAFTVNGINGTLPGKSNIRVNGLPCLAVDTTHGPRRGWIYIITTQKDHAPAGTDPDIVMYRSADGGHSWSAGIRVNQDPLNNKRTQYFPNVHVDASGTLNVIFYDDRTTTFDSTGVFLARSADGGDTWKEYEISDHHFKPYPIGGLGQGYQGDIIDLTSTATRLWPVWMDNTTGVYQVWTVPILFSDLGVNDPAGAGSLVQVTPNPFTSGTTIRYRVLSRGPVSLEVFDVLGNRIAELAGSILSPGNYEAIFSPGMNKGRSSPSVYFFRYRSEGRTESGKMMMTGS